MKFSREIEGFIKAYVKDLQSNSAAIFAGAGMSKASGLVDWPELLRDIATDLGLQIELESDLISLAQFHVNTQRSATGLAKKILEEFSEQAESSDVHEILSRLPIRTFWTTNYDPLIENSLANAYKVVEVKHAVSQLVTSRPKTDVVVYKMHGDSTLPLEAILYKQQYERYHQTHAQFITALSGDLISKTFLFIGFSFSDPNLDYVLSRLHVDSTEKRQHYSFMRREVQQKKEDSETFKFRLRRQELRVDDLKRFGIQALLIDEYSEIPAILREIESRYRKKTVFISGSAEVYGDFSRDQALAFVHNLASQLVKSDFRIVNGFGWGIGSSVINGALEAIYGNPRKYSEDQLIMRPFPQYGSNLQALWDEYRHRMIALSGISIFLFGNKFLNDKIVEANGVRREFEIAVEHGLVPIAVGATGHITQKIYDEILSEPEKYYGDKAPQVVPLLKDLAPGVLEINDLASAVVKIVKILSK